MTVDLSTQGQRIRRLFKCGKGDVTIVAPFIKVGAFSSLLSAVPDGVFVRCVTRWLPQDIAAGVSDPEIVDVLEARGGYALSLVDRLHAKLYIRGEVCLAGSANVTFAGLGNDIGSANVEILVDASLEDPGVMATLAALAALERPAGQLDAEAARLLAGILSSGVIEGASHSDPWFPHSRRPADAFDFYSRPPRGYLSAADRLLLTDVALTNLQPGLSEEEFDDVIRGLLFEIPLAASLIDESQDRTTTHSDARPYLESIATTEFSTVDLWKAFVEWMSHFYPDRLVLQEMTEITLRRAKKLR